MGFWEGFALLIIAFGEFIIAEIMAVIIERLSHFKKSEYFVFATIGFALILFYIMNFAQATLIIHLAKLKAWMFLLFLGMFGVAVLILTKWVLGRRWGFRLVILSLILILSTLLATIGILLFPHINK